MTDMKMNKNDEDCEFTVTTLQFVYSAPNLELYKSPQNDYAWEYLVLKNGNIEDWFLSNSDGRAIDRFLAEYVAA